MHKSKTPTSSHDNIGSRVEQHALLQPGKQTLVEGIATGDDGSRAEESRQSPRDLNTLRTLIHEAFIGSGNFENAGIIDYRLAATGYMSDKLSAPIESGSSLIDDAFAIGVEVAAATLAALAKNPFLEGTIVGLGAAMKDAFHDSSKHPIAIRNANDFCDHYDSILRQNARTHARHLAEKPHTVHGAEALLAHIKDMIFNHGDRIKRIQQNELLDAWSNVLKAAKQGVRPAGVGDKDSFASASTGCLHIGGIQIHEGDPPSLDLNHLSASLAGVSFEASELMLDRRLADIHVSRTFEGKAVPRIFPPPPNHSPDRAFYFGVRPDGERLVQGRISNIAHGVLTQLGKLGDDGQGAEAGLRRIWHHMREHRLRKYVSSVGS